MKKVLYSLPLSLFLTFFSSIAGEFELSWDSVVKNTDGSSCTNLYGYEISKVGKTSSTLLGKTSPGVEKFWLLNQPIGTSVYSVIAINSAGFRSIAAKITNIVVTPLSITNLTSTNKLIL